MGEASHPGPKLNVLSANVTSFLPHVEYLATLDFDVLAMQEVRLTEDSMKIASDAVKPYNVRSFWGKPQPIRRGTIHSTLDAKQGGVGFLYAQRHAVTHSPRTQVGDRLWQTGRWHSIAVKVAASGLIIHVVSIYGHPGANEGGEVMDANENFLSDVFNEAGSLGDVPIVIIGDYNIRTEKSPLLANLITSGQWVDIGQSVATVEGKQPEATYESRGVSSRIDMAFGNSELMRILKGYEVLTVPHDGIKSHRPIKIILDVQCPRSLAWQARKVRKLPRAETTLDPQDLSQLEWNIMERYIEAFEAAVSFQDVDLIWDVWCALAEAFLCERTAFETGNEEYATSSRYRGRGHAASVRKVRLGNQGRTFEGIGMDPERRGLTKLYNILNEMYDGSGSMPERLCQDLWGKACRLGAEFLKGKVIAFRWSVVPTKETIGRIRDEIRLVLEDVITGGRDRIIRNWKRNRDQKAQLNVGELFKQFKPLEQTPLTILKRSDGTITGDIAEMDQILRDNWLPIFAKHHSGDHPEPDVDAFLLRFGHLIPKEKQQLKPLSEEEIVDAVNKFATDGAGGLDGWSPPDLKRLTNRILGLLAHLFDAIEATGQWPQELCWASISLIPKGEGGDPLDLRPITVTPLVYRIWAAARTKQSMHWQESWIHSGQHGARIKHSTSDALIKISLALEESIILGTNIQGLAVDLSKAFDNVPVRITFAILSKLGMDPGVLRALWGMYQQMQRRFKLGKYVGEAFRSTNGILQGCPISVMLLNAIMMVLHKALDEGDYG